MANRMIHDPSYLLAADAQKYWTNASNHAITSGRYLPGGSSAVVLSKTFDNQTGWTVGFNFKYTTVSTSWVEIVTFNDGTTTHVILQFLASGGTFRVLRGSTVLLTSTTPLTKDVEYYVEFQTTIADAGGVVILKVDGVTDSIINSSSQDTRNGGAASANIVQFLASVTGSTSCSIRHIYVNDNSGGVDDTFWGPITIATLTVTGDGGGGGGGTNDWTPSAGSTYQNVDDATPDDDTTYNATSTNGDIDTFTLSNTGYASGTVKGIETVIDLRRTDASSTARVAPVLRISSTNYVRTDLVPTANYLLQSQRERVSPATSSAWTVSELDGMEAGYKRSAA